MCYFMIDKKYLYILIVIFLLSNCTNLERVGNSVETSTKPKNDNQQHLGYPENPPHPLAAQTHITPAVSALMKQASEQEVLGQLDLAASTIERALRIAPQSPQLHLSLARLRLKENKAHAALQIALKGQSLLKNSQEELNQDFWRLIGDCYTKLGNTIKAQESYKQI